MLKISCCVEIGEHIQHKSHLQKTHGECLPQQGKVESFSPKIINSTGIPSITTVLHHCDRRPSLKNQTTNRRKISSNSAKKKSNFILHTKVILSLNPKDSLKKFLELTSEFSKIGACKMNTRKSMAFLHSSNEIEKKEKKDWMQFIIAPEIIR